MITDEQAGALRAIRDDDPIKAVDARVGVRLEQAWVIVPIAGGDPPRLSIIGRDLLEEWETGHICPDCNGIGSDRNANFHCPECDGTGWITKWPVPQVWPHTPDMR